MNREAILKKASEAQRESKHVDFKASTDIGTHGDICELVKDVVAMANSGGGAILFGIANDGTPSGFDPTALLNYDPAKLTDQIAKYTGRQFADFEIGVVARNDGSFALLVVDAAGNPMVFSKAGTYSAGKKDDKVAFQNGTIYVRHGAKSEPANSDDVAALVQRQVERVRKQWLSGIKKVTSAPADHVVVVGPPGTANTPGVLAPTVGRIVSDPGAPGVYPRAADERWKYRSIDVVRMVNDKLPDKPKINVHDLVAVKKVHDLEAQHPEFVYRPFRHLPPMYSDAFVEWLLGERTKDDSFFTKARAEHKRLVAKVP